MLLLKNLNIVTIFICRRLPTQNLGVIIRSYNLLGDVINRLAPVSFYTIICGTVSTDFFFFPAKTTNFLLQEITSPPTYGKDINTCPAHNAHIKTINNENTVKPRSRTLSLVQKNLKISKII